MNKIFLWDSGENIDCLEKNKNSLDKRAYLMLRLGDILYMAYRCIPIICSEMIDVPAGEETHGFLSKLSKLI